MGSYSYQLQEDQDKNINVNLLSKTLVKAGFLYDNKKGWIFSLFNNYHSKPTNRTPITNAFNKAESAYSHLTLNTTLDIQKFMNIDNIFKLNLFVDNILESDNVFMPDPTLSNLNTMPKVSKRSYYVSIDLNF